RAVVADLHGTVPAGADRDVADLAIFGQLAEQNEIADRPAKRLLVQRRVEDLHVEACGRRRVRTEDVEMLEPEIRERQRGRLRRLRKRAADRERRARGRT